MDEEVRHWPFDIDEAWVPDHKFQEQTKRKIRKAAYIAAAIVTDNWDWGKDKPRRHMDGSPRAGIGYVMNKAGWARDVPKCPYLRSQLFKDCFAEEMTKRMRGYDAKLQQVTDEVAAKKNRLEDCSLFISYYSQASGVPLVLEQYQIDMLEVVATTPRLVLLLPATHGKSTIISMWYVIWRICQNPNIRIIVVMKNDNEVGMYASAIRHELERNQALIRDFGPFRPEGRDAKWSNSAIEVVHRQISTPQPTVEFASANSIEQVLGHRCDEAILDDTVTPKTTNTQSLRDSQEQMFNNGINTGPQPLWDRDEDGKWLTKPDDIYWPDDLRPYGQPIVYWKIVLDGTVFHPDDLFHRKGRSPQDLQPGVVYDGHAKGWKILYYDCWKHDENNVATDEPLMPSRWSREALLEQEAQGAVDFAKRYRNIAIDEGHTVFKKVWIRGNKGEGGDFVGCLDDGLDGRALRSWGELPYEVANGKPAKWRLSLGVDPATGRTSESASSTAFVLMACDMDAAVKERYLLDIYNQQIGYEDIISWILFGDQLTGVPWGFYDKYRFDVVAIEKVAAHKYLLDSHRLLEAKTEHRFEILPVETQAQNKVAMVAGLQGLFVDGTIHIPYGTPADREKSADLLEQLQLFPQGKNDYPMAMMFSDKGLGSSQSRYKSWSSGPGRVIHNPFYSTT